MNTINHNPDTESEELRPAHYRGSLMVKNLQPGLIERGKIKIGMKGEVRKSKNNNEFQLPQKLDHFIVTTMERDDSGNFRRDDMIHKAIGDTPKEIPIRLLFNDPQMNFQSRYAQYNGRKLVCSGDGEKAYRQTQNGQQECVCPCPKSAKDYEGSDKCKINGNLSVVIEDAPVVGGVWKFRTTSYNSVVGIMSSMVLIRQITGGILANIPLTLTVTPKAVTAPDGKQQTVYVVGLEYKGSTDALQEIGYAAALRNATHHVKVDHIEQQAKQLLLPATNGGVFPDETADDIVDEFYPEDAQTSLGDAPARPQPEDFESKPKDPVDLIAMLDEFGDQAGDFSKPDYVDAFVTRVNAMTDLTFLEAFWDFNADGLDNLGVRTEEKETVSGAYNAKREDLMVAAQKPPTDQGQGQFEELDADGQLVFRHATDKDFVDALEKALSTSTNPKALWDANQSTFTFIQTDMESRNIGEGIDRCAEVQGLAAELVEMQDNLPTETQEQST